MKKKKRKSPLKERMMSFAQQGYHALHMLRKRKEGGSDGREVEGRKRVEIEILQKRTNVKPQSRMDDYKDLVYKEGSTHSSTQFYLIF